MSRLSWGVCFCLGIVCCFWACTTSSNTTSSSSSTPSTHKGEKEFEAYLERKKNKLKGKKIPSFSIKTIDGKVYNTADMGDKVLLLNFWFAACKPCITEIPSLNELHDQFAKKDLVVLSVSTDKNELAKKLAVEHKMRYHVSSDGMNFANRLEVSTYPTSFLIDKKGIIREVFIGASSFDATYTYTEIKPHLERLLNQ